MTEPSDLTPRQRAVASLVARAYTTKDIAAELRISDRRVRVLVSSIAYLIGANPAMDEQVQIAEWWRSKMRDTPNAA